MLIRESRNILSIEVGLSPLSARDFSVSYPLPLRTCLAGLLAEPENSLMIGDSVHDVKAARAAGMPVGLVPWGYRRAPVEELGADFILDDPLKLPAMLAKNKAASTYISH